MPSSQGHHVRTRGRRRGRLQELPNMPLDIIFEVFSHMDPMSLLNLTRTTKAFRQLLLNRRTAATFWRNARGNVPSLPECPVYMSEPAFANLCFDSHCHKCLRSNIHNVSWAFRARYCRDCRPHMVVERLEAKDMLSQASVFHKNYDIYDLLISESGYGTGREVTNFHRPDLEALIVQWKDSGPDEQDKIHATQVALNRSMRENAQNCAMWQNLQKNLRSAEIDRLKTERYSEILHRLRETEWGEFIDSFPFIVERRLLAIDGVKRARPLSDRSWINLRERIFDGLERTRSALLPPPSRSTIINRIRLLSDVMHSLPPTAEEWIHLPTSIAEMDTLDAISRVRGTLVMTWRAEAFQRINDCDVQVEAA
ncbi:hypothetical protein QCA50_016368 [Cerrena zonata]|uniref:F-box domain-containing protein n=1 Tax=Cerrena zonata TaxID=2478898 RepID=A0AAW0FJ06_9APHY